MSMEIELPHSRASEAAIIGTIFAYPHLAINIATQLQPSHFFVDEYEILAQTILDIITDNKHPDMISVSEKLKRQGNFKVGDLMNLNRLMDFSSRMEILPEYLMQIKIDWKTRQIVKMFQRGLDKAKRSSKFDELHAFASEQLINLEETMADKGFSTSEEVVHETLQELSYLFENPDQLGGLSTSFKELDELTNGYYPGQVTVVGARPGMGKTSFAIATALNAALHQNKVVAIFSLEMTQKELMKRILSLVLHIESPKFRNGKFTPADAQKLLNEVRCLENDRLLFDEKASTSVLEISSKCKQLKRKKGKLDIVIIDYLQLIKSTATKNMNREQEVALISRELKILAKELDCPIMLLAQLNRGLEGRPDKRPHVADIRESGAIENDADLILFLYRDEVYNKESIDAGIAEIIIGKNRHGPMGTVKLKFDSQFMAFRDI